MEIESLLFIFPYAFFLAPFVVCLIVGFISVKAYKVSMLVGGRNSPPIRSQRLWPKLYVAGGVL